MNIDNTLVQKYAPLILSGLVLIIPAVNVLAQNPSPVTLLQFLALLATTIAVYPLRAPWKQVAEVVGVIAAGLIPLAVGGQLTWANWALVGVAIVKVVATHLGVVLRQDPVTDAPIPTVMAPQVVVAAPAEDHAAAILEEVRARMASGSEDRLEDDDALGVDLAADEDDTPGRHEAQ